MRTAAVIIVLFLPIVACGRPKAGEVCKKDGMRACASETTALVCVSAKWESLACRGTGGCKAASNDVSCDNDAYVEGEPCDLADDNYECTVDRKAVLQCKGRHWKVVGKCGGPRACTSDKQQIKCDDTLAEVGGLCAFEKTSACSVDGKALLQCKAGAMVETSKCRGAHGCDATTKPTCDTTVAAQGDACEAEDEAACSTDAKQLLRCRSHVMATVQSCNGGCAVVGGTQVHCN